MLHVLMVAGGGTGWAQNYHTECSQLFWQDGRKWRSKSSGKCSQKRLAWGTSTSTMRRAAHPSGCARWDAGAGCSAIKYQFLSVTQLPSDFGRMPTDFPVPHPREPIYVPTVFPTVGHMSESLAGNSRNPCDQYLWQDAIIAGKVYINIHTDKNTGGEIRGQVILNTWIDVYVSQSLRLTYCQTTSDSNFILFYFI